VVPDPEDRIGWLAVTSSRNRAWGQRAVAAVYGRAAEALVWRRALIATATGEAPQAVSGKESCHAVAACLQFGHAASIRDRLRRANGAIQASSPPVGFPAHLQPT
jgi:hypothetical protein